jgi:hypothetical protein
MQKKHHVRKLVKPNVDISGRPRHAALYRELLVCDPSDDDLAPL